MVGKIIGTKIYVHRDYIHELNNEQFDPIFRAYEKGLITKELEWNVYKGNLKEPHKFSLLHYPDFRNDPHPAIHASTVIDTYMNRARTIKYSMKNPMILHRKELLIGDDYPGYAMFAQLTVDEEAAGLLSTPLIGRQRYWESLLKYEGLDIVNHELRWLT